MSSCLCRCLASSIFRVCYCTCDRNFCVLLRDTALSLLYEEIEEQLIVRSEDIELLISFLVSFGTDDRECRFVGSSCLIRKWFKCELFIFWQIVCLKIQEDSTYIRTIPLQ